VILLHFVASEQETTRLPVRSALFKQRIGGLLVRWVTTSEYPLLYVFALVFCCILSVRSGAHEKNNIDSGGSQLVVEGPKFFLLLTEPSKIRLESWNSTETLISETWVYCLMEISSASTLCFAMRHLRALGKEALLLVCSLLYYLSWRTKSPPKAHRLLIYIPCSSILQEGSWCLDQTPAS
jgi:hypothetical protein